MEWLQQTGYYAAFVLVWLLCAAGILLACLSLWGTWLVVAAAVIAALLTGPNPPGIWTVAVFILLSGVIEGIEALAGYWGVKRRGGTWVAGLAALAGGLAGMFLLGGLVPVIGHLLGMLIGSFGLAFGVEYYRLKKASQAAHVALGAVLAHLLVIFLKSSASLGMTAFLVFMVLAE